MSFSRLSAQILLAFIFLVGIGDRIPAQDSEPAKIDEQEFAKLHRALQPRNETWKSIPWQTSLLAAQKKAAESGKLLFIWAMDGHPLGCT